MALLAPGEARLARLGQQLGEGIVAVGLVEQAPAHALPRLVLVERDADALQDVEVAVDGAARAVEGARRLVHLQLATGLDELDEAELARQRIAASHRHPHPLES